jgi:uncharacterized protein
MKGESMKSWVLLNTHLENKYFYDRHLKRTHLCHPLLFYIISRFDQGHDLQQWIDHMDDSQEIDIADIGRYSKNDIIYYYNKFLLLKENGYFSEVDAMKRIGSRLTPEAIEKSLANATQLTFEVTEKCNLNCEYCGYGKFYRNYDERKDTDLDPLIAKRTVDYLREYWNSPLNNSHDSNIYISFYGGEPLLNMPFIEDMVEYVNRLDFKHNRFTFSMTSNGTLLDRYMDFLVKNNFNLLLSLDGNEANNDYRRLKNGAPAFPVIIENIKKLKSKYPDYFHKRVDFNAVLHNRNSVSDIYHFFKHEFNKTPTINPLNNSGINPDSKDEFRKAYTNLTESLYNIEDYSQIEKDMFTRLPDAQEAMVFLYQYNDFCYNDYNSLLYSQKDHNKFPTGTCLPFSKKVFLTVSGNIMACERIGQKFVLGHADRDKVVLDPPKIARLYNTYLDKMRRLCHRCHNSDFCKQCMFYIDSLEENIPVCRGFQSKKEYSRYVSSFLGYIEENHDIYSKVFKEVIVE